MNKKKHNRKWFWGALRVAALLLAVGILALTVGYREARAQVGESLLGFGGELLAWPEIRNNTGERKLFLNGALLHLTTLNFAESVNFVLNRFQEECAARGGFSAEASLLDKLGMKPDGVFRQQEDTGGVVACFDMGGPQSADEVLRRVKRFAETGDIAQVGGLRYSYVKRGQRGTSALVMWSDQSLPLLKMFPKTGDVPGHDAKDFPRIKQSRRLISGQQLDVPYTISAYRVEQGEGVLQWYKEQLESAHWRVNLGKSSDLVATKGSRRVLVHVSPGLVSVVELS